MPCTVEFLSFAADSAGEWHKIDTSERPDLSLSSAFLDEFGDCVSLVELSFNGEKHFSARQTQIKTVSPSDERFALMKTKALRVFGFSGPNSGDVLRIYGSGPAGECTVIFEHVFKQTSDEKVV